MGDITKHTDPNKCHGCGFTFPYSDTLNYCGSCGIPTTQEEKRVAQEKRLKKVSEQLKEKIDAKRLGKISDITNRRINELNTHKLIQLKGRLQDLQMSKIRQAAYKRGTKASVEVPERNKTKQHCVVFFCSS